jgi:phospholipid/cholesterol/gamma-HCH transport system permease protein
MKRFGAEIFVADLIGLSMLRELGPLMTAILLAGRSGAAFAAEIGTMRVNQEVDALQTMGLSPVRFLVTPRIIAAVLMTPLLVLFSDLVGMVGGALTMQSFSIPIVTFLKEIDSAVTMTDFLAGFVKSFVFAVLIAGIGCLRGLQTRAGASAVGDAATRAVVTGIILLVVDGLLPSHTCWISEGAPNMAGDVIIGSRTWTQATTAWPSGARDFTCAAAVFGILGGSAAARAR